MKWKEYNKSLKKLKIVAVKSLLLIFQLVSVISSVLVGALVIIGSPVKNILRAVFYKGVVKIYCSYWSLLRRLGWDKFKGRFFSFLFNHRTVHFVVGVLVLIVLFSNVFIQTNAVTAAEKGQNTMVSKLITSEFSQFQDEGELSTEVYTDRSRSIQANRSYTRDFTTLRSTASVATRTTEKGSPRQLEGSMIPEPQMIAEPHIATDTQDVAADPQPQREKIITYTVRSGDTISTIASRFGVSVDTILWENDLSSYDMIRPGDELRILPVSGVSHEVGQGETLSYISNQYNVSEEKIIEFNDLGDASQLSIGEELIIPGGEKVQESSSSSASSGTEEQEDTPAQQQSESGASVLRDVVEQDTNVSTNKMNWPTQGHQITQYYSWRHHGLDVANSVGTPIFSADAGTVEYVGWTRGYGNNVIVNHGGGKKTRYAHLTSFHCQRGERVSKGETIGAMGNTGWSTGPHVHFEVIINGRRLNPLNYIR